MVDIYPHHYNKRAGDLQTITSGSRYERQTLDTHAVYHAFAFTCVCSALPLSLLYRTRLLEAVIIAPPPPPFKQEAW